MSVNHMLHSVDTVAVAQETWGALKYESEVHERK